MFKGSYFFLVPVFTGLIVLDALAAFPSRDRVRGGLLYENHCTSCHESQVHIRKNHIAHSLAGVRWQVARWADELHLAWGGDEISDVSHFLYDSFYLNKPRSGGDNMSLTINSSAFAHNGGIPARYTCDGDDISPQINWSGLPTGTKSLVLIVDDPDAPDPTAPKMTWVHWVLYNIPPENTGLPEAATGKSLPTGTLQGLNDWKRTRFGGPCPPIGRHRYFHKLYALDIVLTDLNNPTKPQLEKAMQGHILEQAEMIGTYQRK